MKKILNFFVIVLLILLVSALVVRLNVFKNSSFFDNLFHEHSYVSTNSEVCYFEDEKLYRNEKCSCGSVQKIEVSYFIVDSETFNYNLAIGESDRVLFLRPGDYGYLELNNVKSFDKNLTIIGQEGVSFAGVCITSGATLDTANNLEDVMPSNLTFSNVFFNNDFHVRNCSMDGITLSNCVFNGGAGVFISSNDFSSEGCDVSYFGSDCDSSAGDRLDSQYNLIKNVNILNCTFDGEKDATLYERVSKIAIFDVENISIKGNEIANSLHNAIQLNSRDSKFNGISGAIMICDNEISNTKDRAIRLNCVKSRAIITIKDNVFIDASDDDGQVIKGSNMGSNITFNIKNNRLNSQLLEDDVHVIWEFTV